MLIHGKKQRVIYTAEEADEKKIPYKNWREWEEIPQDQEEKWISSDDDYVFEIIKVYYPKKGYPMIAIPGGRFIYTSSKRPFYFKKEYYRKPIKDKYSKQEHYYVLLRIAGTHPLEAVKMAYPNNKESGKLAVLLEKRERIKKAIIAGIRNEKTPLNEALDEIIEAKNFTEDEKKDPRIIKERLNAIKLKSELNEYFGVKTKKKKESEEKDSRNVTLTKEELNFLDNEREVIRRGEKIE